jgi:hypothetical protein
MIAAAIYFFVELTKQVSLTRVRDKITDNSFLLAEGDEDERRN